MRPSAALLTIAACAFSAFAGEGFRWRIDEVNEISRPEAAGSDSFSGIAWVSNDTYLAVTDWKCAIWELTLSHDPATGNILSCGMKRLSSPVMAVDVEGIVFDRSDSSAWIADERAVTIRQYDPVSGKALSGLVDTSLFRGCRKNSGLESLTISGDGLSMWTCTEEALKADGDRATRKAGSDVRLTRFCRTSPKDAWRMAQQRVYRTDTIAGGPWYNKKKENVSRCGISELCVLDDGSVLVLEREFSVVVIPRLRCRIYETDMSSAVDVKGRKDLSGIADSDKVKKKLLHEITGFSMYEGMCLGPVLQDGSRMLVLVSDAQKRSFRSVLSLKLSRLGGR